MILVNLNFKFYIYKGGKSIIFVYFIDFFCGVNGIIYEMYKSI